MSQRTDKVSNLVRELAAQFLARENNKTSLITVTSTNVSPDLKKGTIFITVLPESKEHDALEFAKRKKGELRDYLKQNMETKSIPFIEIEIDHGEKNRQKIDELLREK
ncbi:ribosome-binding factor A [Patescibacteria group bacterium]|nr:ribosome-binding factor A [Patescibacteria group bacterium]